MDLTKVKEIVEWTELRSVKEVQSFLGFCNFYKRFIKGFSKIVSPLHDLTSPKVKFDWTFRCHIAFHRLKDVVTEAPILVHYHHDRSKILETDASDLALGGVLNQLEPNNK